MANTSGRTLLGRTCAAAVALLLLVAPRLSAQPSKVPDAPSTHRQQLLPAPRPADVLTPNTRQNTPYLKIAARAGLNWAAYSNDRYLDNTALDVGRTSGEQDVYSNASGFGYGGGVAIEYPINTGFSVVGSIDFVHAPFGREGTVNQECIRNSVSSTGNAQHEWRASLNYLKVGAAAKLSFPSFYVLAGLTADRAISSRLVRTRTFDDAACSFPESGGLRSIREDAELPDPVGLHFALRTGFGLVYPISDGLTFSPELTLDFGTSAVNKSPESDLDIYSVSAVLRYELR